MAPPAGPAHLDRAQSAPLIDHRSPGRRAMRISTLVLLLAVTATAGCGRTDGTSPASPVSEHAPSTEDPSALPASSTPKEQSRRGQAIRFPRSGSGTWAIAKGNGRVLGRKGELMRYQVLVEKDITGIRVGDFATAVSAVLGDRRGWTAGGEWRFQQVGPGQKHDFTLYLVTPATRVRLCADGATGYTSCRNGDSVVLNVARWARGVPRIGIPMSRYRAYMVNHEVGHRLGFGHELCPGAGRPAPLMQQQTLGLHRCRANGWPIVKGEEYHGPTGAYDDPIPREAGVTR